jgi:cytoskeleton protein RodZ
MNDELSPEAGSSSTDNAAGGSGVHDMREEAAAPAGPPTAGSLIRAARQEQGIDLASLAAMLKIPLRKLEALEQGRHSDLPGQAFERALAQSACRVLKIDPKPVLALMPHVGPNTLEHVGGGINTPFREPHGRGEHVDAASFFRPVVIVPVLLAIAALVLFYAPSSLWPKFTHQAGGEAEAPSAAASAGVATAPVAPPSVQNAPVAPVAAAPAPAETASAPVAVANAVPAPAASAGVDEVLAHAQTPPTIPVQVTAAEDSWIEVTDAQGHTLLSRTVVAGESVGLDGPLPMRVKIGNAHGTRLTLRGDNVDLGPWTRDNVARLELK